MSRNKKEKNHRYARAEDCGAVVGSSARQNQQTGAPFRNEAKQIAEGVKRIAKNLDREPTPKGVGAVLQKIRRLTTKTIIIATTTVGGFFAVETFFQHQQESSRNQADAQFTASREQLASVQSALRASAVRSLYSLSKFENFAQLQPSQYHLGSHILGRYWHHSIERPLESQCWTLFKEFAQQERLDVHMSSLKEDLVSTALLETGISWERFFQDQRLFREVPVTGAVLHHAQLPKAQGSNIDAHSMDLNRVNFESANLANSNFDNCGMAEALLANAVLTGSTFRSTYLADADLSHADFSFTKCQEATFHRSVMTKASFSQSNLGKADFKGARLDSSLFNQAFLRGASFDAASLRFVSFKQVDLDSVSFDGADILGADFRTALGISPITFANSLNVSEALLPEVQPLQPK